MKKEHLHLLIDEEIYSINPLPAVNNKSDAPIVEDKELRVASMDSIERSVDKIVEGTNKIAGGTDKVAGGKSTAETTEVPKSTPTIKFAFIHDTDRPEELNLLNKIIGACKLDNSEFNIFKTNEEIPFEKAVVFTTSASAYYQSSKIETSEIMYSQPLHILINSKEEKGKLWGALQEFINKADDSRHH